LKELTSNPKPCIERKKKKELKLEDLTQAHKNFKHKCAK
jgi:hypothetical protein